jgi:post-segregation antitoxin (ccd killing protein)
VPQVTIYVPQDLAEALDRQRERLNVSQVCAQALRKEVGKLEAVADVSNLHDAMGSGAATELPSSEPVDETQALVERLRRQKQRSLDHADEVERARTRAEGWLKKAHYEQIKRFGEWESTGAPDRFYAESFRLTPHEEEVTRDWGRQRTRDGLSFSLAAYRRAWHQHVRAFWYQVKDQI